MPNDSGDRRGKVEDGGWTPFQPSPIRHSCDPFEDSGAEVANVQYRRLPASVDARRCQRARPGDESSKPAQCRNADCERVCARGRCDRSRQGKDDGQGSGPDRGQELPLRAGNRDAKLIEPFQRVAENDKGFAILSSFDAKQLRHSTRVGCSGMEAVNRIGWENDHATGK